MVSSMLSVVAALRMSAAISTSMTTVCLTRRSQSQMPTMHSMLSWLRKILSMGCAGRVQGVQGPTRGGSDFQIVVLARGEPTVAGVSDHGGIVGAELGPRIQNLQPTAFAERLELRAQAPIGTDAARDDQGFQPSLDCGPRGL